MLTNDLINKNRDTPYSELEDSIKKEIRDSVDFAKNTCVKGNQILLYISVLKTILSYFPERLKELKKRAFKSQKDQDALHDLIDPIFLITLKTFLLSKNIVNTLICKQDFTELAEHLHALNYEYNKDEEMQTNRIDGLIETLMRCEDTEVIECNCKKEIKKD